jgi:ElaB/YqjD/DUF883 family membrane-anchored ribosome-binding protein
VTHDNSPARPGCRAHGASNIFKAPKENMMSDLTTAQRERVMADLRVVIADAEELLRLGAEQTGAAATEWRARVEARLNDAKASMREMQEAAIARAKAAGQAADNYVHENPWKAIGAAAGVGLLVGLLIGRR